MKPFINKFAILPLLSLFLIRASTAQSAMIVNVASNGFIIDGVSASVYTTNTFNFFVADAPVNLTDLDLRLSLRHSYAGDLQIYLTSPQGTKIPIVENADGGGDNFQDTYFDEEGGVIRINVNSGGIFPDQPPWVGPEYTWLNTNNNTVTEGIRYKTEQPAVNLSTFYGEDPNGTWKLSVVDTFPGDDGFLFKAGDLPLISGWGTAIGTQLIIEGVPEPGVLALSGVGLALLVVSRHRAAR